MNRFRSGLVATGCIAAALLLGSCSPANDTADGPANDTANDPVRATPTPNASTTLSADSPTTLATPGSTVPSANPTDDSTTSTTMLSFAGDPNSEWCTVAAELVVLSDGFEAASVSDPYAVERTLTAFVDRMALIAFIAPPEIVDDVALSVGAFGDMLAILEAADFDLGAADLSTIESQRPALEESSNRIATYNRNVCGLDPDAVESSEVASIPAPVAPTSTSIARATESRRDAAIDLLTDSGYTTQQAECIVNEIENGLPTQDVLSACDVSLEGSTP